VFVKDASRIITLKAMTAMIVSPVSGGMPSYGVGGAGGTQIVPGTVEVVVTVPRSVSLPPHHLVREPFPE
jgi:hypothetical protein